MRKLLALSLGAFAMFLALEANAKIEEIRRDPGDAWPWGAELPFPWSGIQGVWKLEIDEQELVISFKTIRSVGGVKHLRIEGYEATTCELVFKGAGFEQEERVVDAVMVNQITRQPVKMNVRVFSRTDVKGLNNPAYTEIPGSKTVTVLSIGSNKVKDWQSFQLQKLDSNPNAVCAKPKGKASDAHQKM